MCQTEDQNMFEMLRLFSFDISENVYANDKT